MGATRLARWHLVNGAWSGPDSTGLLGGKVVNRIRTSVAKAGDGRSQRWRARWSADAELARTTLRRNRFGVARRQRATRSWMTGLLRVRRSPRCVQLRLTSATG